MLTILLKLFTQIMQYSYIAVEDTNKQTCEDETDAEVDYDGLVDTERRVAEVMDQL